MAADLMFVGNELNRLERLFFLSLVMMGMLVKMGGDLLCPRRLRLLFNGKIVNGAGLDLTKSNIRLFGESLWLGFLRSFLRGGVGGVIERGLLIFGLGLGFVGFDQPRVKVLGSGADADPAVCLGFATSRSRSAASSKPGCGTNTAEEIFSSLDSSPSSWLSPCSLLHVDGRRESSA